MDHSFRITIDYSSKGAEVASVRRVRMRAPGGERHPERAPATGPTGRFLELRDKKDRVLYRRRVGQLLRDTLEVRTGVAEPRFRPVALGDRAIRICLVVPDLPGCARALVCENRMEKASAKAKKAKLSTRDILSIDLTEVDEENAK